MKEVMFFLFSSLWLLAVSVRAESPDNDGLELTLLALDPAQRAAVLLEPSGGLETIRVGDRLEGTGWTAELIRVGDGEARFDTTVVAANGRVRRVDWFVEARRTGEETSRSRVLDPNPEAMPETTGPPKHVTIPGDSSPDQRVFKLSKDGDWSELESKGGKS